MPKAGVARANAADAMLAHQDGDVQIVHPIAADVWKLFHGSRKNGPVTPRRGQQVDPGRLQQFREKPPGSRGSSR